MDNITNLPKDTDSLPDIALYSFDTMDNVKDTTDYLDEANFHQNSNSSILENVFSRTCAEIDEKAVKELSAVGSSKVSDKLNSLMHRPNRFFIISGVDCIG